MASSNSNSNSSFKEKLDFRSYKSSGDIDVPDRIMRSDYRPGRGC